MNVRALVSRWQSLATVVVLGWFVLGGASLEELAEGGEGGDAHSDAAGTQAFVADPRQTTVPAPASEVQVTVGQFSLVASAGPVGAFL